MTLRAANLEQLGRLMSRAQKQRDEALKKIEQYRNNFLPLTAQEVPQVLTAFGDEI